LSWLEKMGLGRLLVAALLMVAAQGVLVSGNANLLANPGAEDRQSSWVPVAGDFRSSEGGGGLPSPKEGSRMFWAGSSAFSSIYQEVDLSLNSTVIDSSRVFFSAGGWVRDRDGRDVPLLRVELLDGGGNLVANVSSGPIRCRSWYVYRLDGRIPPGVRRARFWLESRRASGSSNDGYFDGLFFNISSQPPVPPAVSIRTGPYLQNSTPTSIVMMWETDRPCPSAVMYRESGADSWNWKNMTEQVKIHQVLIEGLRTGVRYEYAVVSGGAKSERHSFRLNFRTGFRFLVYGDSRTSPVNHRKVVESMIPFSPDFVINVGDVVESGNVYSQWKSQHFDPLRQLASNVTTYIAIGNHERNSPWFDEYVCQPGNEHFFAFTYANARFIFLDTNWPFFPGSPQYEWLRRELSSEEYRSATFHFAFFHHPPYSEMWDSPGYIGDSAVRSYLVPLLEAAKVDIVFNGHTHDYERGRRPLSGPDGTYYIITGGGGAPLDTVVTHEWEHVVVHRSEYHFCVIDVSEHNLSFRAVAIDGEVMDNFTVDKSSSRPDLAVEELGFDPERSEVSLRVSNLGFVPAASFTVLLEANGTQVSSVRLGGLSPGEERVLNISWTPGDGLWVLNATVDPQDELDEGIWEQNNCIAQLVRVNTKLPDLWIAGIQTSEASVGRPVRISVTVENRGPVACQPSRLLVSAGGRSELLDIPEIPSMGRFNASFEFTPQTSGLYTINATADPDGLIAEADEDNAASAQIWVVEEIEKGSAAISKEPVDDFVVIKYRSGILGSEAGSLYIRWGINGWNKPAGSQAPPGSLWYYDYVESPMERGIDGLWTVALPVSERLEELGFLFVQWSGGLRELDDNDGGRWLWTNPAQYYEARDLFTDLLQQAGEHGIITVNFTAVLEEAEASAAEGDYSYATGLLDRWTDVLGRRVMEVLIDESWRRVQAAKERGVDTSRIETYLKAAQSRLKFGPWSYAKGYVEKADQLLDQVEAGELLAAGLLPLLAGLAIRRSSIS